MKASILLAALLVLLQSIVSDASIVCSNVTRTVASSADYLFVIDSSSSMCDKTVAIASGLSAFAAKVQSSMIQARYAVVQFGGAPKIMLPFSSNLTLLQQVFYALGCAAGGQESTFEALRGSLPPLSGAGFLRQCSQFTSDPCGLTWNVNATKVMIVLTDEDSDLPTMPAYRVTGQNNSNSYCSGSSYFLNGTCTTASIEPAFFPAGIVKYKTTLYNMMRTGPRMRLGAEYEDELATTADLLIQNGIFLNMVVSTTLGTYNGQAWQPVSAFNANDNPYFVANVTNSSLADNVTTATYQFGHPGFQVQAANFSSFNPASTLSLLSANGFNNSMQARILRAGLYARVFDIVNFNGTSQPAIISAFYNSIVETTSYLEQFCQIIVDPVSSSTAVASSSTITTTTSRASSSNTMASLLSASSQLATSSVSSVYTSATSTTYTTLASGSIALLSVSSPSVISSQSSSATETTSTTLAGSLSSSSSAMPSSAISSQSPLASIATSTTLPGTPSNALSSASSSSVSTSQLSVSVMASTLVHSGSSSSFAPLPSMISSHSLSASVATSTKLPGSPSSSLSSSTLTSLISSRPPSASIAASTSMSVMAFSPIPDDSSNTLVMMTTVITSAIIVTPTPASTTVRWSTTPSPIVPTASQPDSIISVNPEVTQQAIKSDGGKGTDSSIIIALAVGFGLLIFFIACLYALYRSHNGPRFMKAHKALATVFGLSKQNPLYKDQFGYRDNPMYARDLNNAVAAGTAGDESKRNLL